MKKYFTAIIITIAFSLFVLVGNSQEPPKPPSGGHGQDGNQPGGSSPVGSGMLILIGLGAAYGGMKLYKIREEIIDK